MNGPEHNELSAALSALLAKLGPGILGAVVSLRFLPAETPWVGRAFSVLGGVGAAAYVAPAMAEWLGVASSRIEAGMGFLAGTLAMVVLGEATIAVHEAQIGRAFRGWLRRRAGLAEEDPKP